MNYELLKRMRLARGWTAAEASEKLDITPQYLSRIENGRQGPSEGLLQKMIQLYDVAPEDAELLRRGAGFISNGPSLSQAGSTQPEMRPEQVSTIKVDALKTPVLYTNALFVSSDEFGFTIDAGSRVGPTNEIQVVARIGFSLEHAKKIHEALGERIKNFSPPPEGLKNASM